MVLCIVITVFCWISDEHTPECTAALQSIDSKTVILLGKVALWVMVFIFDRFVQHHHSAVRRRGYLDFYRLTRKIKTLPLLIHSAGEKMFHTVNIPLRFFFFFLPFHKVNLHEKRANANWSTLSVTCPNTCYVSQMTIRWQHRRYYCNCKYTLILKCNNWCKVAFILNDWTLVYINFCIMR